MSVTDLLPGDIWLWVGGALIGLVIVFVALRFALSLAARLFSFGCLGVLLLAAAYFALTYLSG